MLSPPVAPGTLHKLFRFYVALEPVPSPILSPDSSSVETPPDSESLSLDKVYIFLWPLRISSWGIVLVVELYL